MIPKVSSKILKYNYMGILFCFVLAVLGFLTQGLAFARHEPLCPAFKNTH
jgi:hypothetical protein